VQTVDTEVVVIVEAVVYVVGIVEPPEVMVLVTGQVVTVSYVITVVTVPPGSEEEPGRTPDGPGVVLTEVLPVGVPPVGVRVAAHSVQMVDTEVVVTVEAVV
jgi:hypothetical protein